MKHELGNATINYVELGDGYPIVILHAMGTDHRAMYAWMEEIFIQWHGWRRIYVDIPGHGESRMNPYVQTSDEMLSLILEFLNDILGNKSFAVVGMSFGGYLAQGILSSLRERVTGLCLISPALHVRRQPIPPKTVFEKDDTLLMKMEPDMLAAFETLMVTQTQDTFQRFSEEIHPGRQLTDRTFLTSSWRTNGYLFSSNPLEGKEFLQPTLLLSGRQDHICGYEDLHDMLKIFPNATYSVLDRAGHLIQFDQRHLLQILTAEWLDRV